MFAHTRPRRQAVCTAYRVQVAALVLLVAGVFCVLLREVSDLALVATSHADWVRANERIDTAHATYAAIFANITANVTVLRETLDAGELAQLADFARDNAALLSGLPAVVQNARWNEFLFNYTLVLNGVELETDEKLRMMRDALLDSVLDSPQNIGRSLAELVMYTVEFLGVAHNETALSMSALFVALLPLTMRILAKPPLMLASVPL